MTAVGCTSQDLFSRAAATLRSCAPDSVICGLTAARLHGLWLPSADDDLIDVIVHPSLPVGSTRGWNKRHGIRARRRILLPDETTVLEGLPITTEARTWFDLADCLGIADLVAAGDSALRGGATAAELDAIVARAWHRPGVVLARQAMPLLNPRSRSRPESHLRCGLVLAGLPEPGVNVAIHDLHGGWLAEPDLSYADVRLALEYNGSEHGELSRMRKDITRGVDVSVGGWRTETFGPVQVFQRMDQVVALVRHLRSERLGTARPVLSGPRCAQWSENLDH